MAKIEALAAEMGVTVNDVIGFVAALRVHMDKGLDLDAAIAANLKVMTKLAENSVEASSVLRPLAVDWFYA